MVENGSCKSGDSGKDPQLGATTQKKLGFGVHERPLGVKVRKQQYLSLVSVLVGCEGLVGAQSLLGAGRELSDKSIL